MDITELRCGNIVTTNGKQNTAKNKLYKIVGINSTAKLDNIIGNVTIETNLLYNHDELSVWSNNIEPIIIDDDLLYKLGFTVNTKAFVLKINENLIIINHAITNNTYTLNIFNSNKNNLCRTTYIMYLHTLQNLIFDIIQMELDINNIINQ